MSKYWGKQIFSHGSFPKVQLCSHAYNHVKIGTDWRKVTTSKYYINHLNDDQKICISDQFSPV